MVPWYLLLPAALLAFLAHYVAVGAGAGYAFTDWNGLTVGAKFTGLDNFRHIVANPTSRMILLHTLELAVAFVVTVNIIGLLLALALNQELRTRNLLRAAFFAPVVMSPLATAYIWQFIFDFGGPLNRLLVALHLSGLQRTWLGDPNLALWTIFVVLVWQFSGLTMVMYLAGLQGIPEELSEAARVDGATPIFRFRKVIFPLLAPAVTVAVTYTLINGLRVFDQVLALTNGGPVDASSTLASEVYKQTFALSHFGYGAALALVLTVLIVVASTIQLAVLRARENRIL